MKIKKVLFALLGLAIITVGCKDEPEYVKGQVIVQFHDQVPFDRAYRVVDSLSLEVNAIHNFGYYVEVIEDSLESIRSVLNSKEYLKNNGLTYGMRYRDSTVYINTRFFDFNKIDAEDWFETKAALKLIDDLNNGGFKWGVLNVPEGEENSWVDELNQISIFSSAELNHRLEAR
jgi:hypothetical protein